MRHDMQPMLETVDNGMGTGKARIVHHWQCVHCGRHGWYPEQAARLHGRLCRTYPFGPMVATTLHHHRVPERLTRT